MSSHHPFHTGFPCPNCGQQRASVRASCPACRYPRHERKTNIQQGASHIAKLARRPFQYHLWWLLAGITVAAIFLAVYTQQENSRLMRGLAGAGMIIGLFHPVIPFFIAVVSDIFREYVWSLPSEGDKDQSPFE